MPCIGIEPVTLRSVTRRSNQPSYAAAQHYHYLLCKQTFSGKSVRNRKQSVVTHLPKIVTIFKQSMHKFSIFYFEIAKSRSKPFGFFCTTITLPY